MKMRNLNASLLIVSIILLATLLEHSVVVCPRVCFGYREPRPYQQDLPPIDGKVDKSENNENTKYDDAEEPVNMWRTIRKHLHF